MNFLVIIVVIMIVSPVLLVKFSLEAISDLPVLLQEGKEQWEMVTANVHASEYGNCWANAVSNLQVGCRSLTQELQSSLALRLTDCFLQMSGQGPLACAAPRQDCLQGLSDREFNAYTEFFTHTQNICYFLQSKLWHEQSEKTIDRLSTTSYKVSLQLVEAEKGQEALLRQQRESLGIQEDMARHMETSRNTMTALMEELRLSAHEQQLALGSLFQQLSTLQNWVVGELSWFDSIFFYLSATIISCLFTSASRTRRARLPLLIVLTVNYAVERYACDSFSDNNSDVINATSNLNAWVWFFRKISVSLCIFILLIMAVTYWDYNAINYQILVQIKKQNSELRDMLGSRGADFVDNGQNVSRVDNDTCDKSNYAVAFYESPKNGMRESEGVGEPPDVFTSGRQNIGRHVSRDKSLHCSISDRDCNTWIDSILLEKTQSFCETIVESEKPLRRSSRLQKSESQSNHLTH